MSYKINTKSKQLAALLAAISLSMAACNGGLNNTSEGSQASNSVVNSNNITDGSAQLNGVNENLYIPDYHDNWLYATHIVSDGSGKLIVDHPAGNGIGVSKGVVNVMADSIHLFTSNTDDNAHYKFQRYEIDTPTGILSTNEQWVDPHVKPYKSVMAHVAGKNILYANSYTNNNTKLIMQSYDENYNPYGDFVLSNDTSNSSALIITPDNKHLFEGYQNGQAGMNLRSIVPSFPTSSVDSLNLNSVKSAVVDMATTNENLYVLGKNNKIYQYAITQDSRFGISDSTLTAEIDLPENGVGNHIMVTPNGKFVYVSDAIKSVIHVYLNSGAGSLTHLNDYNTTASSDLTHPDVMTVNSRGNLLFVKDGSTSTDIYSWYTNHPLLVDIYMINEDGSLQLLDKSIRDYSSNHTYVNMVVAKAPLTPCDATGNEKNCFMFVTTQVYNGEMHHDNQDPNDNKGFLPASQACEAAAQAMYPAYVANGIHFKALLGYNSATRNGVTYYRQDGTKIAVATGPNFTTELENSIAEFKDGTTTEFWTGVDTRGSDSNSSTNSCNYWGKDQPSGDGEVAKLIINPVHGYVGGTEIYGNYGNYTYSGYWSNGWADKCSNMKHLVCVAQ